jgi:hypothetical protein
MNWGKGIIAVLATFMLFIGGMCVYMFLSPADDFDHQYYEKGLSFNHDYDREKQVELDHAQPLIQLTAHQIKFTFAQPAKGTIKFMRPSSTSSDKVYPINSNEVDIPIALFATGKWQLEFEWTSSKKAYLYQQELYIK